MACSTPARTTRRRIPRLLVAGLLAVMAAIVPAVGFRLVASSSTTGGVPIEAPRSGEPGRRASTAGALIEVPRRDQHGPVGEADGVVPEDTTVFSDGIPGVANLDPDLLRALRHAATDAARDGVTFYVDSGWRSAAYQAQLLREAVSRYGSEQEAARWVATPETSPHVSGDAVDIGHADATGWLSEHGAKYGLCQIYRNEPWHYELRPGAIGHGCPRMYADPTHDPRMQQ